MLEEAGYSIEEVNLDEIAEAIRRLDSVAAKQFLRGSEVLQKRECAASRREQQRRSRRLADYREIIDRYVLRFSDAALRFPGGGTYGTPRGWAKRFIEDYVMANGRLPSGRMRIEVSSGGSHYSGSWHDFSDLS
jgi:hypothetical protein